MDGHLLSVRLSTIYYTGESNLSQESTDDIVGSLQHRSITLHSMSVVGGHDYQFVREPSNDLRCSICLCVLRDPHLTSCCGKHFCESCIHQIKSGSKTTCPLCQKTNFNSMLDKSLCRKVNELIVHCPNSEEGCKWTDELKGVQVHLENMCEFVQVSCSLCRVFVFKGDLTEHRLVDCPKRKSACQDCGYRDTWEAVTRHCSVCPCRIVSCPNKCDAQKLKRGDMEEHLNTLCPMQTVPCDFKFAGCEEQRPKQDIGKHNDEKVAHHLSLLARKFVIELGKKDDEIECLRAVVLDLTQEIQTLKSPILFPPVDLYMPNFSCYVSASRWCSEAFYSHVNGYKMCLSVFPNGIGRGAANSYLSVFVNLMRGEYDGKLAWPFRGNITVELVTEYEDYTQILKFTSRTHFAAAQKVIGREMNEFGQGKSRFIALSELHHCSVLHFRVVRVECTSIASNVSCDDFQCDPNLF